MANTTRCSKSRGQYDTHTEEVRGEPGAHVSKTVRELSNGVGLVSACHTESTDLLPPVLNVFLGVFGLVGRFKMLDRRLVVR